MIKLMDSDRHHLTELCSSRKDDIMLLWFLDGNNPHCEAWVDDIRKAGEAVIIAADFCYLLGDVNHPEEIEWTLAERA